MGFLPTLLSLVVAGAFAWLFLTRYWFWRDCIEAATSSCITPDGENLIAGGQLWAAPAIAMIIVAIMVLPRRRK